MTAVTPSAVLVPAQPLFTDTERIALAGFLAGYRGQTREAYALLCRERHKGVYADHPLMPRLPEGSVYFVGRWQLERHNGARVRARRGRRAGCRGVCSGRVWCRVGWCARGRVP
jgi:hypothetical protein